MKRRVIKLGNATLVASLPSRWVKEQGISAGEELEASINGGDLTLTAKGILPPTKREVSIEGKGQFMERLIHTPYRFGVDELTIRYADSAVVELVRGALEKLLGFEIVEQGEGRIIIRNVAEGMEDQFEQLLSRCFLIILDMAKTLADGKPDAAVTLGSLEKTLNKLTNFCERLINKGKIDDRNRSHFLYALVWSLEDIADEVEGLGKIARKPIHRASLSRFASLFHEFSACYRSPRREALLSLRRSLQGFIKETEARLAKDPAVFCTLLSLSKRMHHLSLSFQDY
ncbi:MAG: hypothetical protein V1735_02680 [Nanoarchaeota archaeon]